MQSRTTLLACLEELCSRIEERHGSDCVKAVCHSTLQGRGLLKSHGLSETPIVWRNTFHYI